MDQREDSDQSILKRLPQSSPLLWLQTYLAQVESKELFYWLNKDFGYSNLSEEQIAQIEMIFKIFQKTVHDLTKLELHENPGKEPALDTLLEKYSCLPMLLSMAASKAVLNQSKKGWARSLAVTQKFIGKREETGKKFFGLRKNKDQEE